MDIDTEKRVLNELNTELEAVEFDANEQLASLLRKTEVFIKKVFGSESEYHQRYCQLSFIPEGIIYNKEHYMNRETWDTGIANFRSLLESIKYEFELWELGQINSLTLPNSITLGWLSQNVPIKLWITFIGLLITAFLIGVTVGEFEVKKIFTNQSLVTEKTVKKQNV